MNNKVIFFILFISIIPIIFSISPPKFPVTFYTNIQGFEQVGNETRNPMTGSIANDNSKELFVMNEKSQSEISKVLFNLNFYQYADNPTPTNCVCTNTTYKDLPFLPYFRPYKNFVKYNETDSDIIWRCTDTAPDVTLLFSVKKKTPNVPEVMTQMINDPINTSQIITFIGFHPSPPESEFFRIPDVCAKVPCVNSPKDPSMFFSKLLGD